jgi:hypothetical protein
MRGLHVDHLGILSFEPIHVPMACKTEEKNSDSLRFVHSLVHWGEHKGIHYSFFCILLHTDIFQLRRSKGAKYSLDMDSLSW